MPWLEEAMKDAAWRRYASGRCRATFDPEMSEWGNPMRRTLMTYALLAYERTLGSKTFQYQEEKRSIDISQVAASENETAQTQSKSYRATCRAIRFRLGVVRRRRANLLAEKLQNFLLGECAGKHSPRG